MLLRFVSLITLLLTLVVACESLDEEGRDDSSSGAEEHGFNGFDDPGQYGNEDFEWRIAKLTWFESFPDAGGEECDESGECEGGYLELLEGEQMTEEWIENTLIAAVHSDDWATYKGKILRLRQNGKQIDVKVYDRCNDAECGGCCTELRAEFGFLISLEINTFNQFGGYEGTVEWAALNF